MNPATRSKLEAWLAYFEDLGISPFYHDRASLELPAATGVVGAQHAAPVSPAPAASQSGGRSGIYPERSRGSSDISRATRSGASAPEVISAKQAPSLFEILDRVENDSLEKIRADLGDCTRCRLSKNRHTIVYGVGNPHAELMFVGEGPGADEDAQGIPFVGRAGQLLTQMIENTAQKEGIPLRRADVYICNVVKCRPPGNRTPEPDEMATCGQFLFRQLEALRPKAICALGGTASRALLGRPEGVTKLRGNWYRWRDIPVMVTYHPSYLLRPYNQGAKREAWEDLKKTLHFVYD